MSLDLRKIQNAWARLRVGLPARGSTISPEVPNDLFVAHRSFYGFAAGFAQDQRILDLGCGTGYGARDLADAGAREVVGIDPEPRFVRYANRRFAGPGLAFRVGTAERLPADVGSFDLAVAGNVLSHLTDPDAALAALAARLAPGGRLIASAPPILDGQTLARHRAIPGHRSSRFLWDWIEAIRSSLPDAEVRLFRLLPPPGVHPDFTDPGPSRLSPHDFRSEEIALDAIDDVGGLAAMIVAQIGG